MNLLRQPNNYSCMPTAFAMATNSTPEYYFKEIGHDGSPILFEDMPEPYNHRCFVYPECFMVALDLGFASTDLPVAYGISPSAKSSSKSVIINQLERVYTRMRHYKGVLFGRYKGSDERHCMAWDGWEVLDPRGFKACKEHYEIDSFVIVTKLEA